MARCRPSTSASKVTLQRGLLRRSWREMRYLWREHVRMDNARLIAALGQEPHTPLDEAVEATLVGLGCFTASASSEARVVSSAPR
jgi:nucleoside-diphosphate-sugar epimerase